MLLDLAAEKKLLFVCGKGGVGKTSIASAIALERAEAGARVLVVSTDPAHSLGHLWQQKIGDEIKALGPPGLHGLEIDPVHTTDEHLAHVRVRMQRLVPEHLRGEVNKHLDLARDAPGAHEAALLERMATTIEEQLPNFDLIIFDTAPSGHTTRLVSLPETMAAWTRGMLDRHEHAEKFTKAMEALDDEGPASKVFSVGRGQPRAERDAEIRRVLYDRQQRLIGLRDILQDAGQTAFLPVFIGERLPALETVELVAKLTGSGMHVAALVINKRSPADAGDLLARRHVQEGEHIRFVTEQLPQWAQFEVPLMGEDVTTAEALRDIARALAQPVSMR